MAVSFLNLYFPYVVENFSQNTSAISEKKNRRNRLYINQILAVSLWRCPAPAIPQSLGVTTWIAGRMVIFSQCCARCCGYENLTVPPGEGGRSEIAQEGNSIFAIKFLQDFASCSSLSPLQTRSAGSWPSESPCSADTLPHVSAHQCGSCLPGMHREVSHQAPAGQVSLWACQQAERKGSTGGNRISGMDGLGGVGHGYRKPYMAKKLDCNKHRRCWSRKVTSWEMGRG